MNYCTIDDCKAYIQATYKFLNSAGGNWRNTIYVECRNCKFERRRKCGDFLLVPDYEGKPLIISTREMSNITGEFIDKNECISIISNHMFGILFQVYVFNVVSSSTECPLIQLTH